MTYSEQIKHPKWQKKRLEILERDEFRCTNCDSKDDTLHVHHYLYKKDRKIWEYNNKYLTTLCDECHSNWHTINDKIKEILCVDTTTLNEFYDIFNLIRNENLYQLSQINKLIKVYIKNIRTLNHE